MTPLVIIAAGGHAAEVAAYLAEEQAGEVILAGAFDDGAAAGPWHLTEILGRVDDLAAFCARHERVRYITAVGNNEVRKRLVERIREMAVPNLQAHVVRHHRSWTGAQVEVGPGTLLAPGAMVTTRARIGAHNILNVNASVAHDCVTGDYCNLNPGAILCGNVQLGEGCSIGAGATVIEKRKIGAWTVIGAGAVVTEDLPEGVTAVGVPARIIRGQGVRAS